MTELVTYGKGWFDMKYLILALVLILSTPAMANEPIYLPGNTVVLPNNNSSIIIQGYDRDDLLYRRIVNPYAQPRYRVRDLPRNDIYSACADISRKSKYERCVEDVNENQQKLIRKYQ